MIETPALLLIDDEELIHDVVAPALEEAGFEVASAQRAEQALLLFRRRAHEFCAIVTDVDLGPGPSGWDIARLARELVADIPVIYATGGAGHEHLLKGVAGSVVLNKPFLPQDLVRALEALLETPPAKIR